MLSNLRYWICQFLGWGTFTVVSIILAASEPNFGSVIADVIYGIIGLISTHFVRNKYLLNKWNQLTVEKLIIQLIPAVAIIALVITSIYTLSIYFLGVTLPRNYFYSFIAIYITSFMLISFWFMIYYVLHFVVYNRRLVIDRLKMENDLKSFEIKTIKNNLQPHFIFNALNSIRALIDEDPTRARQGITQLSNILRSSIQADKEETFPLERELSLVKDYLSLETIRYEERLQVEMNIDPHTLELPFPPMMLQTLVENAVKHGIAAYENGGVIRIESKIEIPFHILMVTNSGQYNPGQSTAVESNNFGLTSTRSRLQYIYGDESNISIGNKTENLVELKITLPLNKETK
jgi:LytS/YehU family sensor histidine kinase